MFFHCCFSVVFRYHYSVYSLGAFTLARLLFSFFDLCNRQQHFSGPYILFKMFNKVVGSFYNQFYFTRVIGQMKIMSIGFVTALLIKYARESTFL